MDGTIADLSTAEFERIVEQTIDRRMQVWLTQILDAISEMEDEKNSELQTEFAESLRRSIKQADAKQGVSLSALRNQLRQ